MEKYRITVNDLNNEKLLWHKWVEIAFVLEGTGTVFIDSQSYDIQEKDIFVINSYQIHSAKMSEEGKLFSLLIDPEFVRNLLPETEYYKFECKSFCSSSHDKVPYDEVRKRLAQVVYTLTKSEEKFAETHIYMKLSALIECLIYNFGIQISKEQKSDDRFIDLVQYLNEYYDEDITLSKLAEKEYMSQSYFSRLFQKEIGIKFTEFLSDIRVSNSLTYLEDKKMTVTDIAYRIGFKNVNSFIDAFKKKYGVTPAKYRKQLPEKKVESKKKSLRELEEHSVLFESLLSYVGVSDEKKPDLMGIQDNQSNVNVNLKTTNHKRRTPNGWKALFNVGYAKDILYADIQRQIQRIQKEIGFRWIRFHGLLDDEMFVYSEKKDGTPYYCFQYIDKILDFILEIGLKPVIEFGYMPEMLAESLEHRLFQKRSVIALPASIEKWKALVRAVMDHLTERYGKEEMKSWIFAPFYFLGFYKMMKKENEQEIFYVYKETSNIIREYNPDYQQMGIYGQVNDIVLLKKFLQFAKDNSCLPDIIGTYCYHLVEETEEDIGLNLKLIEHDDVFNIAVSGKENYLDFYGKKIQMMLDNFGIENRKIFLAIWSNNIWQRDLCNDTCFKSAFVFKEILENIETYQAFGYWALSDLMEEMIPAKDVFHGGVGMFTISGIPKSAYWALWLLRFLGEYILKQEDGIFITESENELQIFLYNYCHYDNFYRYRHATKLSRTNRYNVFLQKRAQNYHIAIKGLTAGMYSITRYEIGREKGSVYDQWVKVGAPPVPDKFEVQMLSGASYPKVQTWKEMCKEEYAICEKLDVHEIAVYIIKKI